MFCVASYVCIVTYTIAIEACVVAKTIPGLQLDFAQHMNQTILSVLPVTKVTSHAIFNTTFFTMCKNRSPT